MVKSVKNKKKGGTFVVTYHPKLKASSKLIKGNLYFLNTNDEVRKKFISGLMIFFRSSRKNSS